jgi:hypothetical protein
MPRTGHGGRVTAARIVTRVVVPSTEEDPVMNPRTVAAAGAVALAALAAAPAAQAASPIRSSFTVVTSFVSQPSEIVEASGLWASCTGVTDLSGSAAQVSPSKVRFSGDKQVHCEGGDVFIHYDAELNFRSPQAGTSGTWAVIGADEGAPVQGGSGRVAGDARGCEECIVDVFSGFAF